MDSFTCWYSCDTSAEASHSLQSLVSYLRQHQSLCGQTRLTFSINDGYHGGTTRATSQEAVNVFQSQAAAWRNHGDDGTTRIELHVNAAVFVPVATAAPTEKFSMAAAARPSPAAPPRPTTYASAVAHGAPGRRPTIPDRGAENFGRAEREREHGGGERRRRRRRGRRGGRRERRRREYGFLEIREEGVEEEDDDQEGEEEEEDEKDEDEDEDEDKDEDEDQKEEVEEEKQEEKRAKRDAKDREQEQEQNEPPQRQQPRQERRQREIDGATTRTAVRSDTKRTAEYEILSKPLWSELVEKEERQREAAEKKRREEQRTAVVLSPPKTIASKRDATRSPPPPSPPSTEPEGASRDDRTPQRDRTQLNQEAIQKKDREQEKEQESERAERNKIAASASSETTELQSGDTGITNRGPDGPSAGARLQIRLSTVGTPFVPPCNGDAAHVETGIAVAAAVSAKDDDDDDENKENIAPGTAAAAAAAVVDKSGPAKGNDGRVGSEALKKRLVISVSDQYEDGDEEDQENVPPPFMDEDE